LRWDVAHASTADDHASRFAAPSDHAVLLSFLVLSLTPNFPESGLSFQP
jgi:hypothetical protein